MNFKGINPLFLVGMGVAILLALSGMVAGSYGMMLVCFLAAGALYFMGMKQREQGNKMSAVMESRNDAQQKFVTDPAILKKLEEPRRDPTNLAVNNLSKGSILDYDLKTWQVQDTDLLFWTDGPEEAEHQVEKSLTMKADNKLVNMRVMRDVPTDAVALTTKINVFEVDEGMNSYMAKGKFTPPTTLQYDDEKYYRGSLKRGFKIDPKDNSYTVLESWEYTNKGKSKVLIIEHEGDDDLAAYSGDYINKYAFENLLPAPKA